MEWYVIVANILGAVGMFVMTFSAIFKKQKITLSFQSVAHLILVVSDIFVKAFSALSQEALCVVRDVLVVTRKLNNAVKIILIILIFGIGMVINIIFDNSNIYGFLGVIGNTLFTIDVFYNSKKIIGFKIISIVNNIIWMLLFMDYQIYTSAIFNAISGIINTITMIWLIVMIRKGKVDGTGSKIEIQSNEEKEEI